MIAFQLGGAVADFGLAAVAWSGRLVEVGAREPSTIPFVALQCMNMFTLALITRSGLRFLRGGYQVVAWDVYLGRTPDTPTWLLLNGKTFQRLGLHRADFLNTADVADLRAVLLDARVGNRSDEVSLAAGQLLLACQVQGFAQLEEHSSLLAWAACRPETDRAVCADIVSVLAGEEAETQLCGLDRPPLTCRPAGGVAGSAAERLNDAACLAEVGVARAGDRALVLTTMALVRLAQGRDPEALNLARKAAPAKGADDRGIAEAIQTVRAIAEARCGDPSEAARLIRGVLAGGSVDDVAPHIRNLVEFAITESPVAPRA
jgi:hypothetical protein